MGPWFAVHVTHVNAGRRRRPLPCYIVGTNWNLRACRLTKSFWAALDCLLKSSFIILDDKPPPIAIAYNQRLILILPSLTYLNRFFQQKEALDNRWISHSPNNHFSIGVISTMPCSTGCTVQVVFGIGHCHRSPMAWGLQRPKKSHNIT